MQAEDRAEPGYAVVSPLGRVRSGPDMTREYLDTLDGKNVAFLWDYLFKGPEMWEQFSQVMREQYPTVNFVGYEQFGNIHGSDPDERANVAAVRRRMTDLEVHAAIVAVGA